MTKKILEKKIGGFETRHKIISFLFILLLTILTTRIITSFIDPNTIIKGFEIHHFYYGLLLLIITSLLMLFQRGHFRIHLTLTAISLGLIIDEIVFIGTKIRGTLEYSATFPSAIILVIVIVLIAEAILYFSQKRK